MTIQVLLLGILLTYVAHLSNIWLTCSTINYTILTSQTLQMCTSNRVQKNRLS